MTMHKMILAASAAALCFSVATAQASGFQLKEQSSSMQGHSFAGATAKADDLSTMFFNPAGMTRLENSTQVSVVASYVLPSAKFSAETAAGGLATVADGNGGDGGVGAVVPSFYGMMDMGLGDRWRTGISVNTPFGLSTSYKEGWVGRYHALDSELMTINVAPSVAYKLTDTFSLGANVQMQYADARLTNNINNNPALVDSIAKLAGDDVAFGWGIGALWQATDSTRLGANYRSRIVHKLEGEISFSGPLAGAIPATSNAKAKAGLTTPDILSVGIVHDLNDKWSLLGEVAWTNWSTFDDLTVIDANGAQRQSVDESWNDTFFFSAGAEYKHSPQWTFRGGLAYDQAAVGTAHRTFRIPETDRVWGSVGASYNISPATSLDMNFTHIYAKDSDVDETSTSGGGRVTGEFDAHVNIATVGVNFKF